MDIEDCRNRIDGVNKEIVEAISDRMELVDQIDRLKGQNGMDTRNMEREEEVKKQFEDLFQERNLPVDKGRNLAELLINMAVERQKKGADK